MEATPTRVTPQAALLGALMKDRLLQVGVIIWLVSLLPSFFPVLSPDATVEFVDGYGDIGAMLVILAGMARAYRSASDGRERRFWLLLTLSPISILLVRASMQVHQTAQTSSWDRVEDLHTDSDGVDDGIDKQHAAKTILNRGKI